MFQYFLRNVGTFFLKKTYISLAHTWGGPPLNGERAGQGRAVAAEFDAIFIRIRPVIELVKPSSIVQPL
jgi:hypothetical protein